MGARPVLRYPDPRLAQPSRPVERFDADLRRLVEDIAATMAAAPAVGLTAAHVGILQRVVVIRLDSAVPPEVFVNPVVTWTSVDTAEHDEGSVSLPGVTEKITRPARIRLRYQDMDGTAHEQKASGFLAACLQHEIDQLDGIFWIQRLSRLRRDRLLRKAAKIRREQD